MKICRKLWNSYLRQIDKIFDFAENNPKTVFVIFIIICITILVINIEILVPYLLNN